MPKLDKDRVTYLIREDRRFRGDVRKVAEATGIPYGTLRNAIGSGDQMRYSRVSVLAEALLVDVKGIVDDTGIPDKPPEQPPNSPKAPRERKDKDEKKTGPKRDTGELRAAS
jgi:hypothetical protein